MIWELCARVFYQVIIRQYTNHKTKKLNSAQNFFIDILVAKSLHWMSLVSVVRLLKGVKELGGM